MAPSSSIIKPTVIPEHTAGSKTQFRIYVGSYEHNLLCLSLILSKDSQKAPVFQPIFHFQAHILSIKSIAAAKRYLVTGSNDEHIKIYDLQKRKELGTLLGHQGSVTTLKFSREHNEQQAEDLAVSGKWLLSGSEDGNIIIWRTKDWEIFGTLKGHKGRINDLSIHPSGRVAVSVAADKTVRLWNLMTAKKAASLKIKSDWQSGEFVRWSINGDYFVVGLLRRCLIYKTSEAKIVRDLPFSVPLMHIEVYKIGGTEYLVVGLNNGSIEFYKLDELVAASGDDHDSKPESEFKLLGHSNRIKDFKLYRHDGEDYLVSISSDGNIVVWDLSSREQIAVYNTGERLNCVEISEENIEKSETMKRRWDAEDLDADAGSASESEVENEAELKRIMEGGSAKKRKKKKKAKVTVSVSK